MALTPLFRIAWRNVRKNWRHSLGSMLSIVVGFVAIGLFEGYLSDLEDLNRRLYEQRAMFGTVLVEKLGASASEGRQDPLAFLLHRPEQAFVDGLLSARQSEVVTRMRVLLLSGLASSGRAGVVFFGWGHDVAEGTRLRGPWAWNAVAGRPLHLSGPNSVMVGGGLARLLDCDGPRVGEVVNRDGTLIAAERPFTCRRGRVQLAATTESGQLNAVDAEIAGFVDAGLKELDTRFALMPLPLAQRLLDTDAVSFYVVGLADRGEAARFAADLNAAARGRGLALAAVPWYDHVYGEYYRRGMALLGLYRVLVVLIVVTIAGMSVFTTMLKAVNERVREIGTLRSLGYRRPQIVVLFTLEAALLALVSATVGLAVTAVAVALINGAAISYTAGVASLPIPLTVSLLPRAVAFAAIFLSGVAVFASLFPARRAARLSIPDALGHA